jgi:hypothetical protein
LKRLIIIEVINVRVYAIKFGGSQRVGVKYDWHGPTGAATIALVSDFSDDGVQVLIDIESCGAIGMTITHSDVIAELLKERAFDLLAFLLFLVDEGSNAKLVEYRGEEGRGQELLAE